MMPSLHRKYPLKCFHFLTLFKYSRRRGKLLLDPFTRGTVNGLKLVTGSLEEIDLAIAVVEREVYNKI